MNRVAQITQTGNLDAGGNLLPASNGVAPKTAIVQYNAASQVTDVRRYNNRTAVAGNLKVHSRYAYDSAGRVQSITHGKAAIAAGQNWNGTSTLPASLGAANMLAGYFLTYDADNRVTSIATQRDGFKTTYSYDTRDQLTGATSSVIAGLSAPLLPSAEGYNFDATGNRKSSGGAAQSAAGTQNQLQTDGTYNYLYDAEGNVGRRTEIATGKVTEYAWDHRNRLVSVTDRVSVGGALTKRTYYTYDAFDRRVVDRLDQTGDGTLDVYDAWIWDGDEALVQLRDLDGQGVDRYRIVNRFLQGPQVDMVLADEQYAANVGYLTTGNTPVTAHGNTL